VVVVQHDDEILFHAGSVVQRFVGHASGQCAVADDGNDGKIFMQDVAGLDDSETCGNGSRRVSCIEGVAAAFRRLRETGNAAEGSQPVEFLPASAQDLMRVGLMADIPDDFVFGRGKGQKQGHRQFNRSQIAGKVAAVLTDLFEQEGTDFRCKGVIILRIDFPDVIRCADSFENQDGVPPIVIFPLLIIRLAQKNAMVHLPHTFSVEIRLNYAIIDEAKKGRIPFNGLQQYTGCNGTYAADTAESHE